MRAFASIREKRRLSGGIVVALLLVGALASLHHHALASPAELLRLTAGSAEGQPDRAVDCVVCRATGPAGLVIARGAAPPVPVARALETFATGITSCGTASSFSPRAPPAAV